MSTKDAVGVVGVRGLHDLAPRQGRKPLPQRVEMFPQPAPDHYPVGINRPAVLAVDLLSSAALTSMLRFEPFYLIESALQFIHGLLAQASHLGIVVLGNEGCAIVVRYKP